jgi:hypothetical protein
MGVTSPIQYTTRVTGSSETCHLDFPSTTRCQEPLSLRFLTPFLTILKHDSKSLRNAFRFRLRSVFGLIATSAAVVFFGLLLSAYFALSAGPVNYRWLWPAELKKLFNNMPADVAKEIQDVRVECVKKLIDKEYLWRFYISNQAYEVMKAKNKLTPMSKERVDSRFYRQPVVWWDPDPENDVEFTSSDELPHTLIMYDRQSNVIYAMDLDQF